MRAELQANPRENETLTVHAFVRYEGFLHSVGGLVPGGIVCALAQLRWSAVEVTRFLAAFGCAQITHSLPWWSIPAVLAANSLSLLLYNVAGMFVTDELGAVSRTVFESARTLFVWLVREEKAKIGLLRACPLSRASRELSAVCPARDGSLLSGRMHALQPHPRVSWCACSGAHGHGKHARRSRGGLTPRKHNRRATWRSTMRCRSPTLARAGTAAATCRYHSGVPFEPHEHIR